MGFRNPFRLQVDENDVAYITDYSPDSRVPQDFRGPAGTGRVMVVRGPSNYGWPLCYRTDLPYYRWNFVTAAAARRPAAGARVRQPATEARRTPRGGTSRAGRRWSPGLEYGPPVTNPEVWYSFNDNLGSPPLGTPCFEYYNGSGSDELPAARSLSSAAGGVGPHGAAKYTYDPEQP